MLEGRLVLKRERIINDLRDTNTEKLGEKIGDEFEKIWLKYVNRE